MKTRFVLDESSWEGVARAKPLGVLSSAIERLVERLDAARVRREGVVKHPAFYETDLGAGVQLGSLIERDCPVQLDRDLALQMFLALDQANEFDDFGLSDYDVVIDGRVRFAPGVAWAHTSGREGCHVAVFPLPLGVDVPVGRVSVTVVDATVEIFFVAEESQHVGFFRSVITLENANEAMFERLVSGDSEN